MRLNIPELMKDRDNVAVLCQPCHAEFDVFWGHMWPATHWRPFPRMHKYRQGFTDLFDRRAAVWLRLLEMAWN